MSLLESIIEHAKNAGEIEKTGVPASQWLKNKLDPWFVENKWTGKQLISRRFPSGVLPSANYTMDWQTGDSCQVDKGLHSYSFEYCFDNRQAIGTNLLKMETVHLNSAQASNHTGILLTGTTQALRLGGWDNGIASCEEYLNAIKYVYERSLSSNIVILSLNAG